MIRSTVPDEWVSTAVVVPDALAPKTARQVDADQKHWAADARSAACFPACERSRLLQTVC